MENGAEKYDGWCNCSHQINNVFIVRMLRLWWYYCNYRLVNGLGPLYTVGDREYSTIKSYESTTRALQTIIRASALRYPKDFQWHIWIQLIRIPNSMHTLTHKHNQSYVYLIHPHQFSPLNFTAPQTMFAHCCKKQVEKQLRTNI